MLSKLRTSLTYANVVSTLCLFIVLGGGAYAAATITGKDVKNSSLTGKDVKNSSLTGKDAKNSSLTGKDVRNSSLTTSDVTDGSLLAGDFKPGQLPAGPRGATGPRGRAGTDASLNGVPAGGDLDGSYPNPTVRTSETMQYVADTELNNGFYSLGAGWAPVSFYKDREKRVHLRGLLGTPSAAPASAYVFSLPVGYRPCDTPGTHGGELLFPSQSGTGVARIDISVNGNVTAHNWTSSSHLTLNGISFATDNC